MSFHKNLRGGDLHGPSQELVENNTGVTISKMKAVRLDGNGTVFPQVQLANPNTYKTFGIASDDILAGKAGYIQCIGFMQDVDTSAWMPGTQLYSGPTGNLSTTVLGDPIALVVSQSATLGLLYVYALTGGGSGPVSSNPWELDGNTGIDPAFQFLGTTDATPLPIRTNNQEIARFDTQGRFGLGTDAPERHFEQKSHISDEASGRQVETFYLETNSTAAAPAYVIPLLDPQVAKVEFVVTGRLASDASQCCSFKRSGLFYREASNVQTQGGWQSDFTMKANANMKVDYVMSAGALTLRVTPHSAALMKWTGYVIIHFIN